ncbi:MAG TPA: RDD family protein [Ginsengibacter sp.]
MTFNCPKCGSEFIKGTKFCQTCGCNLELEFIENPICPKCKTTYPVNTKFCVNDGFKLVRPEDLVPRCVICDTSYSDDVKFCPKDGGEVKIIFAKQPQQSSYNQQMSQNLPSNQKYPKASLGNRFIAALLDGLITVGLSIPAIIFLVAGLNKNDSYNNDGAGVLIIIAILFYFIPVVYGLIKDGLGQGQSWGKSPLDLMVVNLDNNTPCDKGKSFFRNFISALVSIIPFIGWLIEPIMVLATNDGRKLGDKAANTQVIDKKFYN